MSKNIINNILLIILLLTIFITGTTSTKNQQEAEDFFAEETAAKPKKERKILFYRNPMNPAITSPVFAKDEMGMDYIPVYEDETQAQTGGGISGMAPVIMSDKGIELSGVITAKASKEHFTKNIRTVGRVVPDETRIYRLQTRVSGWIEKLYVNYTGKFVKKGDPLLSIYSPELFSSQEEFLQTRETILINAAKKRLMLFNVPENFINELEKSKKPVRDITIDAPASGFITVKNVFEGQKVEPGMELFIITDLTKIWVEADFYEYEAKSINIGQDTRVTSSYDPSMELKGKVIFIYPYLNSESRTLKARMDFQNDLLILKPGMYVDVTLMIDSGESVIIPDSAVIYTGVRHVVFISKGAGRFEPREIKVGAKNENMIQVLSGVEVSENVAIKANFLLDSESKLQAIIQGMKQGGNSK